MAETINVGDIYRATAEFRVAGVLTDPTEVTARSLAPDGTESALTALKESVGIYYADVAPNALGIWRGWFVASGTVVAVESFSFTAYALPEETPRYLTPEVLRVRLAPNGDTTGATAASLPDSELARHIASAEAEVNGRLSDQYATPFDPPAPLLVGELVADIAAFKATLTHRKGNPVDPNDPTRLRYDGAVALLGQIATGEVDLPGVASPVSGEAALHNPYEGQLFGLADFGLGVRP